jgi:hypothetical protein
MKAIVQTTSSRGKLSEKNAAEVTAHITRDI